jgi:hypothetical protein
MQSHFEILFEAAGERYPHPEDLSRLTQYVASIPERLKTYQWLRDQELTFLQKVADQLQDSLPEAPEAALEQSLKNGALVLRYCAMGLLVNDEALVHERITSWLSESLVTEPNPADAMVYRLMTQDLNLLPASQHALLQPMWAVAIALLGPTALPVPEAEEELTLAAMF